MSLEAVVRKISEVGSAAGSVAKALLRSRRPFAPSQKEGRLVILANGPSLRHELDTHLDELARETTLAVNFAANAPEFFSLNPDYYVLADPHFFNGADKDANVARLWVNLRKTDWPMTLFLPLQHRKEIQRFFERTGGIPACITLKWFNLTPAEGWRPVVHALYRRGLATPRPRNVLIASIMVALREGFRDILILGADHSWLPTLRVDDENRVISVQPHFYEDDKKERERVTQEYRGYHLHDILGSMTVAFRSYHQIADYARTLGARITNATPGSYIDAFARGSYSPLPKQESFSSKQDKKDN